MPKGVRHGGRQKGALNKRTLAALAEKSKQISAIKRLDQKKATEILNDLMQTAVGMVAKYQREILAAERATKGGKPGKPSRELLDDFWKAMDSAGVFAKALAPFQDPTFKAIVFTPTVPLAPVPGEDAKVVEGKVIPPSDPVALQRFYQQMVKQVG